MSKCPYIVTSNEGTHYCRLGEERIRELEEAATLVVTSAVNMRTYSSVSLRSIERLRKALLKEVG